MARGRARGPGGRLVSRCQHMCGKATRVTDQGPLQGQVKETYPAILHDLLKSAQSAQQRCPDASCKNATWVTDQTSRKRQVKGTCPMTSLKELKVTSESAWRPQSENAIMGQGEKAIMETDHTSRKGQVKGTYPNILDDLLKRAQRA